MKAQSRVRWAVVTAGALLLTACNSRASSVADKAGGSTIVLKLATIDEVNGNGQSFGPQAFVDQLSKVSGGRLRVDVTRNYGDGAPDSEVRLVQAIVSGAIDGGWPSTRAFANAGIKGLQAVEAPLTLTSYGAEKALVTSPIAQDILGRLKGSGVAGLGLTVGPLRRPFAGGDPLLDPSDWKGIRFRTFNSPVQDAFVKALGATPVQQGFDWSDAVADGSLRGAEFDIAQYAQNGQTVEAGMVTANVVLWPKVFVLSLSQKRYDSLTEEQRGWVRTAAEKATQASVDANYDETTIARKLCNAGARFIDASAAQVAALKTSVAPVIDTLARDPVEGPLLASIQKFAEGHSKADVPDVPVSCRTSAPAATPIDTVPGSDAVSSLPSGIYRVEISLADVTAAGQTNNDGWTGTWTIEVDAGTFKVSCAPLDEPGHDCGNIPSEATVEAGHLTGTGNVVTFNHDPELLSKINGCQLPATGQDGHCNDDPAYSLGWAVSGDKLTFTDTDPTDPWVPWNWVLEPLTKIG
jgi:TRAP-type C4-dicarboxylate transport system substrate-binding protein